MAHEVDIRTVTSRTVAVTRFTVTHVELGQMAAKMGAAYGAVMAHLRRIGAVASGPAIAHYEHGPDGFTVAAGFPVGEGFTPGDGVEALVLPAGDVAHTTHMGSYETLTSAYEDLRAAAADMGRPVDESAPMWDEYWTGPEAAPEETRTEVFWPLAA